MPKLPAPAVGPSVRLPMQIAAAVLALSCAYEGIVLAGVGEPGDGSYYW